MTSSRFASPRKPSPPATSPPTTPTNILLNYSSPVSSQRSKPHTSHTSTKPSNCNGGSVVYAGLKTPPSILRTSRSALKFQRRKCKTEVKAKLLTSSAAKSAEAEWKPHKHATQFPKVPPTSSNRLTFKPGTPNKINGRENIRRLTEEEKLRLYKLRSDLNPRLGDGGFDMGKWMNGGGCDVDESSSEEEESDDDCMIDEEESYSGNLSLNNSSVNLFPSENMKDDDDDSDCDSDDSTVEINMNPEDNDDFHDCDGDDEAPRFYSNSKNKNTNNMNNNMSDENVSPNRFGNGNGKGVTSPSAFLNRILQCGGGGGQ